MRSRVIRAAGLLAGAVIAAPAAGAEVTAAAEPTGAPTWSLTADLAVLPYADGAGEGGVVRGGALGLHALRRFGPWGIGLAVEGNLWRSEDFTDESDYFVSLLAGLEGERLSAGGRIRTRLGGGVAALLEGTDDDEAGQIGFYVDLRPVGYRWLFDGFVLVFDPLTLATVVPAASGIPLVDVQYRMCLSLEVGL